MSVHFLQEIQLMVIHTVWEMEVLLHDRERRTTDVWEGLKKKQHWLLWSDEFMMMFCWNYHSDYVYDYGSIMSTRWLENNLAFRSIRMDCGGRTDHRPLTFARAHTETGWCKQTEMPSHLKHTSVSFFDHHHNPLTITHPYSVCFAEPLRNSSASEM